MKQPYILKSSSIKAVLLLALVASLSLLVYGKALADAGGFPTPTPTITPTFTETTQPSPSVTPTSDSTSTPTTTSVPLSGAVASSEPTSLPAVANAAPQAAGPGLICWPFALLIVLVVVIVGTWLLSRRSFQR
jgi:hypothetical protein